MEHILRAIIGGLANRFLRGGGFVHYADQLGWKRVVWFLDHCGRISHDIIFALVFAFSWWSIPVLAGAMAAGRSFGWGRYIGGIINRRIDLDEEPELAWLDKILLNKTDHPVTRCTVALSVRGLVWSLFLALGFYIASADISYFILTPIGLTMGIVYLTMVEICGKIANRRDQGWVFGEIVFGAVLWGSISYLHTVLQGG